MIEQVFMIVMISVMALSGAAWLGYALGRSSKQLESAEHSALKQVVHLSDKIAELTRQRDRLEHGKSMGDSSFGAGDQTIDPPPKPEAVSVIDDDGPKPRHVPEPASPFTLSGTYLQSVQDTNKPGTARIPMSSV